MTEQIPDRCHFDGREWSIEEWEGNRWVIPTREQLGLKTSVRSTANWDGRIDHFLVYRDDLYLLKIEVDLSADAQDDLPLGQRKETLLRYEPIYVHDDRGERDEHQLHRTDTLIYDNLMIPYLGTIILVHSAYGYSELPSDAEHDDYTSTLRARLTFERGKLMESHIEDLRTDRHE